VPPDKITGKTSGRIDIFNAEGEYLLELPSEFQPCDLAVDSVGNLYVDEYQGKRAVLYEPSSYPPTSATEYGPRKVIFDPEETSGNLCLNVQSLAVDPSNDHLYLSHSCRIEEYNSAAEGSQLLKEDIGANRSGYEFRAIDVYGANHDLYASMLPIFSGSQRVVVFDGADKHINTEIDGSNTPSGGFDDVLGFGVAVDQSNGDVYVDDTDVHHVVDQFDSSGDFIGELPKLPKPEAPQPYAGIAVDAPTPGQVSYDSPNEGEVYLGSGVSSNNSRLFAYRLSKSGGPEVRRQAVSNVTETETTLEAEVNPHALATHYHFEYTTQARFEAEGFTEGTKVPIPDAELGPVGSFVAVSEPVDGLQPGIAYRFRVVATNEECATAGEGLTEGEHEPCGEGPDASFATYPVETGLPDERAYELVTPPDTDGRIPTMSEQGGLGNSSFLSGLASTDGGSITFGTEGGALPGIGGGGFHDVYEARRGPGGWQSEFTGLSGPQSSEVYFGGISSDHTASFWTSAGKKGTFEEGSYIRRSGQAINPQCSPEPQGHFELIGCGSLASYAEAHGKWISPGATHVIFTTQGGAPPLEPNAPPAGTSAIYDRTPDGVTHVVSLKPGDGPFAATEDAEYRGTSADGSAVAFEVSGTLYVRLDDERTLEVASGHPIFGGFSRDGSRLVYLESNATEPLLSGTEIPQGEVFVCDVRFGPCAGPEQDQEPIRVGSGEESVLVNVSADGSHVYFVSPRQLVGSEGVLGEPNLYVWNGSSVHFITTLDATDVSGEGVEAASKNTRADGLGLWVPYVAGSAPTRSQGPGADPSRTTPDGSVLVFQSRASLTGYKSAGHSEIYRYDDEDGAFSCLSCNPTGVAAGSDARLQSDAYASLFSLPPVTTLTQVANLADDGRSVFFESGDRLVPRDSDHKMDVYEWESQGKGGCEREGGCIHLISSGQSGGDDYLYAVTSDGQNVFFLSGDLLVPQDRDNTPSIYDARVDGGFPEVSPPPACQADSCQGPPGAQPGSLQLASSDLQGSGNVRPGRSCPKGRRKIRKAGKAHCASSRGKHRRAKNSRRVAR
jgi:hypothetical protein